MIKSIETAKGTIVIREASFADTDQFRELRLFALKDAPTAFSSDLDLNIKHSRRFWEDRLKPDPHGIIIFAEHENQLIGMTGIRKGESSKTKHSAGIWGVYVRPEWRGLHIAEGLMDMCIEWARLRSVEIVKLSVMSTNESAIRLYERCGFTVYGTEPQALYYEDQYYDGLMMSRSLMNS
ncbi:MAG TPA: GNAT family N-acetyltransferase [Anaerolineales bacterium]|nr:GNAT family N-acetyltransferase [Anaerolineales bacterium]